MESFILIAGLGNPGPRYAQNRHNIGFQTLEELAKQHRLEFSRNEHHAATAHGTIGDYRVILAKPQTWMNDSGNAVGPLMHYYKIPVENLLVIYDDLDIPLGTLRFRPSGSSGGHRGIQSIIQHLSTQTFGRLRLGIGRPPGRMDAAAYVLQDFSADEEPILWEVLRMAPKLICDWLDEAAWTKQQGTTWHVEKEAQ